MLTAESNANPPEKRAVEVSVGWIRIQSQVSGCMNGCRQPDVPGFCDSGGCEVRNMAYGSG